MKTYGKILVSALLLVGIANAAPPTLILKSPKPGICKKTEISFTGSANDEEDGKLNDYLVWGPDIDGLIGTGPKIKKNLSVGLHTITLSVKDSEGYTFKQVLTLSLPRSRIELGSSDRATSKIAKGAVFW